MASITMIKNQDGSISFKATIRRAELPNAICRTFRTKTDALRWARKIEGEIIQQRAGLIVESERHTLNEAIERWRNEILPTLRASTQVDHQRIAQFWSDRLGKLALARITPAVIAQVRDELATQPVQRGNQWVQRKPATIARYLAVLGAILQACVRRWHWLESSPLSRIERPRIGDNSRQRFLTKEEINRLLQACRDSPSPALYPAVCLAISTGARRGEIFALRWRDLDLERGLVVLRSDAETLTKGGTRPAPLNKLTLAALRNWRRAQKVIGPDRLVFPGKAHPDKPIDLKRPLASACRKAGLAPIGWHTLRHSAASWLAAQGLSLLEIGGILGHRHPQTTKRYAHLVEDATLERARKAMDDLALEG